MNAQRKPVRGDPLVLASSSRTRAALLRSAGVEITVAPAGIDETAVQQSLHADGAAPRDVVDCLAELKAMRVAARHGAALVLGADQVLVHRGEIVDRARSVDEARAQLRRLRGERHDLLSAAVIATAGAPVWRHVGRACLTMRPFSDAFIEAYLERIGDAAIAEVGIYRIEGIGAQLFTRVEGNYFTVLGLPLLEVLGFLRTRGVLAE